MIDHTKVGQILSRFNGNRSVYAYFNDHYKKTSSPGVSEGARQADKVMRFASREFIRASFGHVGTAVCGADPKRIFMEVDLPELIANDRIETINAIPMQYVRDIHASKGEYAAFRKICQAEVVLAFKHAKATTHNRNAYEWQDAYARRQLFTTERKAYLEQARLLKQSIGVLLAVVAEMKRGDSCRPAGSNQPRATTINRLG